MKTFILSKSKRVLLLASFFILPALSEMSFFCYFDCVWITSRLLLLLVMIINVTWLNYHHKTATNLTVLKAEEPWNQFVIKKNTYAPVLVKEPFVTIVLDCKGLLPPSQKKNDSVGQCDIILHLWLFFKFRIVPHFNSNKLRNTGE